MIKTQHIIIAALLAVSAFTGLTEAKPLEGMRPNIVYILCDDLGYGDVQCLNPERGKIATPHMDQLAAQGIIFTDAHTSSSVCTPTRYGILMGRYNWRTHLQSGVLKGYSESLIAADCLTVAGFLKAQGYATACIGKWHLGMDMPFVNGKPKGKNPKNVQVDWKGIIKNGLVNMGFDYYYGIAASLDMPPYIYIENDRFVGEATSVKGFPASIKGENIKTGAASEDFEAVDELILQARDAWLSGKKNKLHDNSYVGYWTDASDTAQWTLNVPAPGKYVVKVVYSCAKSHSGSDVQLTVAGKTLTAKVGPTASWEQFEQMDFGVVNLNQVGETTCTIGFGEHKGRDLFNLKTIIFVPVAD